MFEDIDYKNILKYFEDISAVGRPTGDCRAISQHLVDFAKEHQLGYEQDESLNVYIHRQASPGFESAPVVVLQGHMDMVCVKTPSVEHDFHSSGVKLQSDGEYISADGTTLGADDGIALAYGMALMSDPAYVGPALDLVFTTDEEREMTGAYGLHTEYLRGKSIVNIDTESSGEVYLGAAGSITVQADIPLTRVPRSEDCVEAEIEITGLSGGHSGIEIHKGKTNAIILMGQILFWLYYKHGVNLLSIAAGEADNVICTSAKARVLLARDNNPFDSDVMDVYFEKLKSQIVATDPNASIICVPVEATAVSPLTEQSFLKNLTVLQFAANGVIAMSQRFPGLVESSSNLAVVNMGDSIATYRFLMRSSVKESLNMMKDRCALLFRCMGGQTEVCNTTPVWEYQTESKLKDRYARSYAQVYGHPPLFKAIHAGLECGIIGEKLQGADIISIGPDVYGAHSVLEKLNIKSAINIYKVLEAMLAHEESADEED